MVLMTCIDAYINRACDDQRLESLAATTSTAHVASNRRPSSWNLCHDNLNLAHPAAAA